MSVLAPEVHNELAQLLDALQSSDNEVRSQAEEHLANMLLMGLVEQIQGSNDSVVRPINPKNWFLLLILLDIPDSLLCCSHFPPNSLQKPEAAQRRDCRTVSISATRGGLHHQIQTSRSIRCRDREFRAK
jgi:hypothetical protein